MQKLHFAKLALIVFGALSLCSCIERWFPSKVSNGITRLTVNNLGKFVLAISDEQFAKQVRQECKLKEVSPNALIEESENGYGTASWEFHDCVYDFGKRTVLTFSDNCTSTTITYSGKVTVSGRRTLNGILTGNPDFPVVPTNDGIHISFTNFDFENFRVESNDQPSAMTMVSGGLSFDMKISLGKSIDGLCEIPLPNPTLTNIQYKNGSKPNILRLPGFIFDFDAEVSGSDFGAQVGRLGNIENFLFGKLTLWGEERRVPSDGQALDPSFSRSDFEKSISCTTRLKQPASLTCEPEDRIVQGVANLTAINLGAMLGMLTKQASAEPGCDFQNFEGGTITKTTKFDGTVTWPFQNCVLDFGQRGKDFSLGEGSPFKGQVFGKVIFSGTRTLSGRLTGNAALPVVPETGEIRLSFKRAQFENFSLKVDSYPSLTLTDSVLSFDVIVHLMKSGNFEVFRLPLENPTFENIKFLQSSKVILSNPPGLKGDFTFTVESSNLHAQFGRFNGKENLFGGSLDMLGKAFSVAGPELIPDFKRVISSSTISDSPKGSFEKIEAALGDAASRLSILNFSRTLQVLVLNNLPSVDDRPECRLRTLELNDFAKEEADPNNAGQGTVTWQFAGCKYDLSKATNLPTETKSIIGTVTLSGQRKLYGRLSGNRFQPIVPMNSEYLIDLTSLEFRDLRVIENNTPYYLTMVSGSASVNLTVPLQIDPKTRLYAEPANDIIYEHLRFGPETQFVISVNEAPAAPGNPGPAFGTEIKGDFMVPVHDSDLYARVGENKIKGTIGVFDSRVLVPTDSLGLDGKNPALLPIPTLHQHDTIESFDALMVARFLMLNMSTIAQEAYSEDLKADNSWYQPNCGFSSTLARYRGKAEGEIGQRGRMQFSINDCVIVEETEPGSLPDPCSKHPPLIKGRVTASGTQTVRGLREKRTMLFMDFDSIIPDNPHAVEFDFPRLVVDNFETFMSTQSETISGGLRMKSGVFSAKVRPVLAEKKETPCDFSRTTPIAEFEVAIDSNVEVELELYYRGLPFFQSKPLTINSARLKAKNGIFDGTGNNLSGDIVINGGRFTFDTKIDTLDPFYTQDAFDKSYECRTKLEPGSKFFNEFAIHDVLPSKGWTSNCPGARAAGYPPRS